jgi:Transcriptional activator, adenine-specific DNA methyltransferase
MKKYQIIYADPPWLFEKSITKTFACKYPCLGREELLRVKVKDISDNDCALFLWVTSRHIPLAIEIIKEWGFDYKTIAFIWVKTSRKGNVNHRLGYWTLSNAEICLLGIKGHT